MKIALRALILVCFFVIVFIPVRVEYEWIVWTLITGMLGLVSAYFWVLYGVSEKQAAELLDTDEEIKYSKFSGIVTGHGKAIDLIRGRFLITDRRLVFIKKSNKNSYEITESIPLVDLSEYSTAKVLSFRKGIIVTLSDETEYRIVISRLNKEESRIRLALGW